VGEERRVTVVNSTQARAYVHLYDVSTDLMSIEPSPESQVQDVTTFGTTITGKSYAVTLQTARMVADGFYAADIATGIDARLAPLQGLRVAIGLWPAGDAAGLRGYADDDAVFVTYKAISKVGSVVGLHMEWECNGGADLVVSLEARQAVVGTGSPQAFNPAVDNGAATTNGGYAYFRVFAADATPGITGFRVAHSPDNSSYATLATSTLVGVGAERIAVAGTVERYLRRTITLTAGKSVTVQTAFCRL
jgi:hypothetical protein